MPEELKEFGPWAVALALVLFTFKDIVLAALRGRNGNGGRSGEAAELIRALERNMAALERVEQVQTRVLDVISDRLEASHRVLQALDVRTEELLRFLTDGRRS